MSTPDFSNSMNVDGLHSAALETESTTLRQEVEQANAGERLDTFLSGHIQGWSRSRIQRLIEDGDVLVNERQAKSSYKLRSGDVIDVELIAPPASQFTPENIPLEIAYEDEDVVVVNKPAGMIVHPGAGVSGGTLANALAFHFNQLAGRAGAFRPGIVHRLDKDTSGLIVVAKTEIAHENLSEQFRARTVKKAYVALVHGAVKEREGRIEEPIARDPRHRTRMAVVRGGRHALSLYRIRTSFERFTLLDVEIKTGRTHQIRVHLKWLNHPVVGDETYGGGRDNAVSDPVIRARIRRLGRVFLHAAVIGFLHPRTEKAMKFEAPLPQELESVLELLGGSGV